MLLSAPLKLNPLQATSGHTCKMHPHNKEHISIQTYLYSFFFSRFAKLLPDATSIQTTTSRKQLQTLYGSLLRI
jgi:hypothetical protein